MNVTATQVRAIARALGASPRTDLVDAIVRGWDEAAAYARLTTRKRAAAFLGQIMTETGGLQILSESGAYRAATIMKIFGVGRHSARVTQAEANAIAALPVSKRGPVLFNRVYGVGNPTKAKEFKNYGPNDGWLYRGGGMMQTTGKSNYANKEKKTGLPLVAHPELLQQPDTAFKAAWLEWGQDGRANRTADAIGGNKAQLRETLAANRRVINGGTNGLDHFVQFYAKALAVLADYEAKPATLFTDPTEDVHTPLAPEDIDDATASVTDEDLSPPNVQPVDPAVRGDPILFDVQTRLKARRYPPGLIDGRWGSGTSGALSGFMNDRGLRLHLPLNLDEFHDIADEVQAELTEAEGEGWFRPVSEARANVDANVVKELAPEVVPAKRNYLAALWGSIVAFFTAIWDTVSGYVSQAWDFFTDHKDVVDDHPGIMSTVWDHVTAIPAPVWLAVAGAGLAFIAFNSWSAIKTSTKAVQNGERQ